MSKLAITQLDRYSIFQQKRKKIAQKYFRELPLKLCTKIASQKSSFYRFPLWIENGYKYETTRSFFEKHNIAVRRGVDELLHQKYKINNDVFPNAENCFTCTLSIPIYANLSETSCDQIIQAVKEFEGTKYEA